jgi:hypothetical protein
MAHIYITKEVVKLQKMVFQFKPSLSGCIMSCPTNILPIYSSNLVGRWSKTNKSPRVMSTVMRRATTLSSTITASPSCGGATTACLSGHDALGVTVEGIVLCKMYHNPRNHGPAATTDNDLDDSSGMSLPPEMTSSRGKRRCATMSTPTPCRLGNITRTYTTTPLA